MKKFLTGWLMLAFGFASSLQAASVVVFTEIMYHPATNEPAMEWIELRNQLGVDVDISNWSIENAVYYKFPTGSILKARNHLVVAVSNEFFKAVSGLTNVVGPFTNRLSNGGATLELRNNNGRLMDEVNYGTDGSWPVAPDGSGVSLAKRDSDLAGDQPESWTASDRVGGTPGTENFPRQLSLSELPGLVSYWNFSEPGATVVDQAGQNNGILGAGVEHGPGGVGRGLLFDGTSNAFVNVGSSLTTTSSITLEAVLLPGWSGTGSSVIFHKGPPPPVNSYVDSVLANRPAAYWRLGDTNTTIRDATTHARHGTATAGVTLRRPSLIPTDTNNPAARATGTNRIIFPGFEKIGPGGHSVEYWLRAATLPAGSGQNLVGDGESAGDYFLMNYILGPSQGVTGAIRSHFGSANQPAFLDSTTALRALNIYHIVTTWNASADTNNAVIYINGIADRVGTVTRNVPAPGTTGDNMIYIGFDGRAGGDGSYTYDEVALYDHPLTAADVRSHFWAGTLTNYHVNRGNTVLLAFQNDGNNALANPPVPPGPVLSFGLTIRGIYSELDMPLDGAAGRPSLADLENGQPHHVVASYDSATGLKAIYVDGVLRSSVTLTGLVNAANSADAIFGNIAVNGTAPFAGMMDELAFWNRALTATEIQSHASAIQAGRDYFAPAAPLIVASLAFNELASATNGPFWLELLNHGTNRVDLGGFVLRHDGATNYNHDVVLVGGTVLNPGQYLALDETQLGFHPAPGDRLYLYSPARNQVFAAAVVKSTLRGRYPEGSGPWLFPDQATPGTSNHFGFRDEIVINEIMYNHQLLPATSNAPAQSSPEAWIELYNRGTNVVDLTGWSLAGGISFRFPAGKTIGPGGFLVVARDGTALREAYPGADVIGNFGGQLGRGGDTVVLKDATGNPADEVAYFTKGRWPVHAAGGGSSLELRDPNADNFKAEAWAASDETDKSAWQHFSYRAVARIPPGSGQPTHWQDFILGLQDRGECLIDDLSVIESPTNNPAQIIANGDFENGLAGWRMLGTHNRSQVKVDPDNPGNRVLHVVATGYQEHMHNHIERTLNSGKTIVDGREYQISFRARWLAGNNLVNTRLYFNRAAKTSVLPVPVLNGTPGAPNSRLLANTGPTFSRFQHLPIVPAPGAPVTVSVLAQDPHGVASCQLWWSANGGAWMSVPMPLQGDGRHAGTIPGLASPATVQFYVRALDGLGAAASFPARGAESGALYTVQDGQAMLEIANNVRVILSSSNINYLHGPSQGVDQTNVMSNDFLPCTVVYNEQRTYYDCGVHLRGSQRGRYSDTRTGFHIVFPPDDLFRGVHPVMLVDRSGAGDSGENRQEEVVIKHMLNRAGGIPGNYTEICRLIAPRRAHTGPAQFFPRHEDQFVETTFENEGSGTQFEMELIYSPNSANAAGFKNPQPDGVIGTDLTDLGDDKEIYRYNFMIKNQRDTDDYGPLIELGKAWSLNGAVLEARTRELMDMDQWLRAYALASLCSVGDMYTFGNNHNFFTYRRPSDGKFVYFPWDMDFAFSRGAGGALVGDQNLGKIVSLPSNLRVLYTHMLDIIDICYNTNYMGYWTDHYAKVGTQPPVTQNYGNAYAVIRDRVGTVRSAVGNPAFNITGTNVVTTANNFITLSGTAPVTARTIRINGVEYPMTWTSFSNWRVNLPLNPGNNNFTFEGFDLYGRAITNAPRSITVNQTGPAVSPVNVVVINEIMYHPTVPGAEYVEIMNTSSNAGFDLTHWRLDGLDFNFPANTMLTNLQIIVLAANSAVFYATYGATQPIFAEFKGRLDPDGESLRLIRRGATPADDLVIDRVRYENQRPWPLRAAGGGPSLQLMDPAQDNARVSNWDGGETKLWRYVTYTNIITARTGITTNRLSLLLDAGGGDVYVDDVFLAEGIVPETGSNRIVNGDFEAPLAPNWIAGSRGIDSSTSSDYARSGSKSLHLVMNSGTTGFGDFYQTNLVLTASNRFVLSFWYLPGGKGSSLTARLSTTFTTSLAVGETLFTPGTANVTPVRSLPPYPLLWLNEVQPENVNGIVDAAGAREPWIELYNSGPDALDLSGYSLADNYTNLTTWAFPAASVINPGEFKVIFADNEPGQTTATEWHASFRLNRDAGSVALVRNIGTGPQIVDYLNYTGVGADRSFGDYPDGQLFDRQLFQHVTPGGPNDGASTPLVAVINEWMASNTRTLANSNNAGRFDDWFELYNPGDQPANLAGAYLTDNLANKFQFRIPAGYVIPPHGHLLVWADNATGLNSTDDPDLHVSFQLARGGESIGLFAADGRQIDAVTFLVQTNDVSQGRFPDGGATVLAMTQPTPRSANLSDVSTPPTISSVSRLPNGDFSLTWGTISGRLYRVEYKNDLNDAEWISLGGDHLGNGNNLTITDAIGTLPHRFYRVVQLE